MATDVTDATFNQEVLKSATPVLVDFWAPWCGPCKSMLPIVDDISHDYEGKVKVVKVNVDENSAVPEKYNILSIPTFLIMKGGDVVDTVVGAKPKEELARKLDAAIGG